ncbi:hypothetical protein [Sporichthya sp.]|uniref:hypothetical protein n=1 Tax=Sporichthya sp. TaxID=65475 RepID=UPI00185E9829|nr:hypothetical protein [Sporichthya sp.]MBA3741947.1 hypothetical protein [Sporichthya sp.]
MTELVLVSMVALLLLVAALSAPRDSKGTRHLLSGYNIVLASFALYGLFPAIILMLRGGEFYWAPGFDTDHGFARAVALTAVALLAFLYGYSIATRRRRRPAGSRRVPNAGAVVAGPSRSAAARPDTEGSDEEAHRSVPAAWQLAAGLIIAGLLMRLYVVTELGGMGPTVARLSGASRAHLALDNVAPLLINTMTLAGIANAGATWFLVTAIRVRRPVQRPTILFVLILASSFLVSGKRLVLILPLLVVVCAVHVYRRPVTYRWAPWLLLAVPALGMATLMTRVFLPASQADIVINLDDVAYANGSAFSFYFNSLEFSTTEMMAVASESAGEINSSLGGNVDAFVTTNLTPFTYAIPRALFPGKPESYTDMSHGISASVENSDIHYATVGYACTLVGTSFITAGIVGVLAVFAALGYVTRRYDESNLDLPRTFGALVRHALVLTVLFQYMRQGTLGWTFIVAIFQQYGFLIGAVMLRDRRAPRLARRMSARP